MRIPIMFAALHLLSFILYPNCSNYDYNRLAFHDAIKVLPKSLNLLQELCDTRRKTCSWVAKFKREKIHMDNILWSLLSTSALCPAKTFDILTSVEGNVFK